MALQRILVAQDGSGDFATIPAALDAADDATATEPMDIVIHPGTYEGAVTTRNWVNLRGVDRESCIITYDGGAGDVSGKHTVSAMSNTTLKNLTIVGIRVKYCVHSDGAGAYVLRLENCVIRRVYPKEDSKTHVKGYGIGLHADQHIVMRNCLVEADLPVYLHNYPNEPGPCSMTLEGCTLRGKECAMDVFLLGSKQRDVFVIHDSVLEGGATGIEYRNARNVEWAPKWCGESEMELVGSGNRVAGISGAEIRDDTGSQRSGLDLTGKDVE